MTSLIHEDSYPGMNSGLDLFDVPPTAIAIQGSHYVKFEPKETITETGTIHFRVHGMADAHLDLNSSYLKVKVKLKKTDGNAVDDGLATSLINNMLDSLFTQITVTIGGKVVSATDFYHHYKSYITHLLSDDSQTQNSLLEARGWFRDTPGHMTGANENKGWVARKALTKTPTGFELVGTIDEGIFGQEKFLVPGVSLGLDLYQTSKNVRLLGVDAAVVLESVELYIKKVMVDPALTQRQIRIMETQKVSSKYPFTMTRMQTLPIAAQRKDFSEDIPTDKVPLRIVFAFVKSTAFQGAIAENPYQFEHCNITRFEFTVGGEKVVGDDMRFDFEKGEYMDGYISLFQATKKWDPRKAIAIDRASYPSGYTLFAFDLTPDDAVGCYYPETAANLRVSIEFNEALANGITMLCYMEYQALLEVGGKDGVKLTA